MVLQYTLGQQCKHVYILQINPITSGSNLLTFNLFALKRYNPEPILTVKIIEWGKFIDNFGLSIEADASRLGKKKVYIFHIGYIPSPSYVSSISFIEGKPKNTGAPPESQHSKTIYQ